MWQINDGGGCEKCQLLIEWLAVVKSQGKEES